MSEENIMVLYHAGCPDGFGSAWSFWRRYGEKADYVPVKHGESPPDVKGRKVFVVDFSYPRTILLQMNEDAESLTVLDHHISAQKDLGDLDFCHFDMNHSGAYLSWVHLFGEDNVPLLISYIEDRDLWKWELDSSMEILSAVDAFKKDFKTWDRLSSFLDAVNSITWAKVRSMGEGILKYKDTLIASMSRHQYRIDILEYNVPVINVPFFQSEIASDMAEGEDFSAAYYYDGEGYCFSLRSRDDGVDVSKIASCFGGGGHRNAAGFRVVDLKMLKGVSDDEESKSN